MNTSRTFFPRSRLGKDWVSRTARSSQSKTTAEGVETEQQLEHVRFLGCTEMQGYLFSPPRRVEDIRRLLRPRAVKRALIA
jgi:EAL domain-containing protein (putative c-di-GMP-specific phosphodiesterase class I)